MWLKSILGSFLFCLSAALFANTSASNQTTYDAFFNLLIPEKNKAALEYIDKNWRDEYRIIAFEMIGLSNNAVAVDLYHLLKQKTGENFGYDFNLWYQWLWNQPQTIFNDYGDFKSALHQKIDPKFAVYFKDRTASSLIRLDEVRWGGVVQDGIPPLRQPNMLNVDEATYLEDSNTVFGIEINGDARAYPKRVLAWHEMFVDTVGGINIAGVYCTLCGTVIIYKTDLDGTHHELGTSGFLYRSNKVMYDKSTQSLWNTFSGKPIIGPLVNDNIKLKTLSVVTTDWGTWKDRHPKTQVLDIETGYSRDYGEGVAYQDYFSTDRLMFNVPKTDPRLKNKDEVLIIRAQDYESDPLAISADFLSKNTVYQDKINNHSFVILTDQSGANRVYDDNGLEFIEYDGDKTVIDNNGQHWTVYEDRLENDTQTLKSLSYHRAFWFGWFANYPQTRLVK